MLCKSIRVMMRGMGEGGGQGLRLAGGEDALLRLREAPPRDREVRVRSSQGRLLYPQTAKLQRG